MFEYQARVEKVVDGDTVDLTIDLGFDVHIKSRVRLYGIDTPESRTRDLREKYYGKLATARVKQFLALGVSFEIKTQLGSGKYGRVLADIYVDYKNEGNRVSICDVLVRENLAVPYQGENKKEIRVLHEKNWDKLASQGIAP